MDLMKNWPSRLKRHFTPGGPGGDDPEKYTDLFPLRKVLLLLVFWMLLWTLWQSLCIGNAALDVAENIAWGQNFDWGYDKNPYFGAWLSYAVFKLFHASIGDGVFYFVSQFSAMLGLLAVYLLANDIFKNRFSAFLVIPLGLLIPYFSYSACEFNDDMLSISLYGLTALFFYRSVRRNTTGLWLAAGACAGLAFMTKYLAGALLLALGLLLLFTTEGRACWKKPGLYLGAALFCLLVLPNAIWIFKHDFIAVEYAFSRAELREAHGWSDHILNFLDAWGEYGVLLILPAAALLLLPRGKVPVLPKFDRLFVFSAALGPMILSSLFPLFTGGRICASWLTPYFVLAPLPLIMWYRPAPELRALKYFAALTVSVAVLFLAFTVYEFLYSRPYVSGRCTPEVYPGKKIAMIVTEEWRKAFAVPCPFVIGSRKDSCFMCYYSPDHPKAFFEHDPALSPWIDPREILRKGAVILWREKRTPKYLDRYPHALRLAPIELERQLPPWVRTFAPAPKKVIFHALLIPPGSAGAAAGPGR